MSSRHRFLIDASTTEALRLDQWIARKIPEVSRAKAKDLLAAGAVSVNGRRTKKASRIPKVGEQVTVYVSDVTRPTELPQLAVSYEDEDLIVVDKPSGIASAPTPESDRNDLLSILAAARKCVLFPLHRLDQPTSGLIAFCKNKSAAARYSELLRSHAIQRSYIAYVWGDFRGDLHHVSSAIEGRDARTTFRALERKTLATMLEATLETGRTHQVRIHAMRLGYPIAGDRRYGGATRAEGPGRLALHAKRLVLPRLGESPLEISCALPEDLRSWFERLS